MGRPWGGSESLWGKRFFGGKKTALGRMNFGEKKEKTLSSRGKIKGVFALKIPPRERDSGQFFGIFLVGRKKF